jgi:hypothetical protein
MPPPRRVGSFRVPHGGDPDIQGYYFNHSSYTPLERPAALGDKAFYTEEEALAAFKRAVESDAEVDPRVVHYDWKEFGMDAWQMSGVAPNLRTSLIVDPPDGRLPPLTPEARARLAAAVAAEKAKGVDVTSPGCTRAASPETADRREFRAGSPRSRRSCRRPAMS